MVVTLVVQGKQSDADADAYCIRNVFIAQQNVERDERPGFPKLLKAAAFASAADIPCCINLRSSISRWNCNSSSTSRLLANGNFIVR